MIGGHEVGEVLDVVADAWAGCRGLEPGEPGEEEGGGGEERG